MRPALPCPASICFNGLAVRRRPRPPLWRQAARKRCSKACICARSSSASGCLRANSRLINSLSSSSINRENASTSSSDKLSSCRSRKRVMIRSFSSKPRRARHRSRARLAGSAWWETDMEVQPVQSACLICLLGSCFNKAQYSVALPSRLADAFKPCRCAAHCNAPD